MKTIKHGTYTCNTADIIDAFNDGVIIFFEKLQSNENFKLDSDLYTYLFSLARNSLHNNLKKKEYCLGKEEEFDADMLPDYSYNDDDDNRAETLKLINNFKQNLSQTEKKILHYRYVQNLTWHEIAERMSAKSPFTMKRIHFRLIQEMREMLRSVGKMR